MNRYQQQKYGSVYIIGNRDKTKFMGYDGNKLTVVEDLLNAELEIMPEYEADLILSTNKNTHFFIVNEFTCKYKIKLTLEEDD